MERLQKVIAHSGVCSRRKAEELITANKVKVNGQIVNTLGAKVNENDKIEVEGKLLKKEKYVYFLLNKPKEYVCTAIDNFDRPIVTTLIDTEQRIYPVGRLDYDTTGALLLTNDGELTNILTHPSKEVQKTYIAIIKGKLTEKERIKLETGVVIDGKKTAKALVNIIENDENKSVVEVSIIEGRNHQIKKMFLAVNHFVKKLHRQSIGFLNVNDLKVGSYRPLTKEEVAKLFSYK